jgi:hypothetical protein
MQRFFTRERFGEPQVIAAVLLLVFLAQCVWLASRFLQPSSGIDLSESFRIEEGLLQWRGQHIAGTPDPSLRRAEPESAVPTLEFARNHGYDANHSPLYYLIASAPLLFWRGGLDAAHLNSWGWLARAPCLMFGVLLGASLWYVARRLYGNAGGYIALILYCFSPAVIWNISGWLVQPEMGATWGAFGALFTAIAVAHTLYAPREVVLWNWRRIILLGMSLALAVGSQFSLLVAVPIALGFMLYLAPSRKGAALTIWSAACFAALLLLWAAYSFHARAMWDGLRHASFLPLVWSAFGMSQAYWNVATYVARMSPALMLAVPAALSTFAWSPRTRYFGNTAPLLVAAIFLLLTVGTVTSRDSAFSLIATLFLFVFVAGVFADLLETAYRPLVMACLWCLLGAAALLNILQLARARVG